MSQSQKQYNQYFSTRPSISITMPSAKRIRFVAGSYITDKQDEIDFLDKEIAIGHQMIFTKQGQEVVNEEALDPLAAVKKKAVEEYLAKQAAQADPSRDMGNSTADLSTSIMTSKGIGAITVGSKSGSK